MINRNQILRMLEQKAWSQLIQRVLGNGRCDSPLLARLFSDSSIGGGGALAVAARALALQRLLELSLGPCADADAVAVQLVVSQERDGLFGSRDAVMRDRCCATAVALRAIITLERSRQRLDDLRAAAGDITHREPTDRDLHVAITHALEALAHQVTHGEIAGDPIALNTLLWQLSGCVDSTDGLDLQALRPLVEHSRSQHDSPLERELHRHAIASAA